MNHSAATGKAILLAVLATAALPSVGLAEEASLLQNNPFKRPVFNTAVSSVPTPDSLSGVVGLDLRAILVAGRDSLVNVDGTIIRVGQEHDGYRLVSVDEDAVVFHKDGDTLTVKLYQEEGNDEQN